MTEIFTSEDVLECQAVVLAFYAASDARDDVAAAACFLEHGIWYRLGTAIKGREKIAEALRSRAEDRTTAHLVTNLRVVAEDASDCASAHFLTTVYAQHGDEPVQLLSVLISHDRLERVGTAWSIASKHSQRHLSAPSHGTGEGSRT